MQGRPQSRIDTRAIVIAEAWLPSQEARRVASARLAVTSQPARNVSNPGFGFGLGFGFGMDEPALERGTASSTGDFSLAIIELTPCGAQ
jgi:hypothetical protein